MAAGAVVAAGAAGLVAAGAAGAVVAAGAAGAVVAAGLAGAVVAAGAAAGPPQAATRKTSAMAMDRIDSPKNRLRISTLLPSYPLHVWCREEGQYPSGHPLSNPLSAYWQLTPD